MRYLDGELDEESAAEVAALLEHDADARDKLAGLALSGDLLRGLVEEDARGDGIADAVMIKVGVAAESQPPPRDHNVVALPRREAAPSPGAPSSLRTPVSADKPANDNNARLIYMIATAAAAVAAGLYFWSGRTPDETPTASAPPPPAQTAEPAPKPAAPPAAEPEEAEGVEIASVDFGGEQSGSVFYISAPEKGAAATAVVWVTDPGE
jgi:hypothetical protein